MPDKSDRLNFNPHQRFLSITPQPERAEYRKLMMSGMVQAALVHSFAQIAGSPTVSREELNGALKFIDAFQNFAEPQPVQPTYPDKSLQAYK